jgi:LmbE family N-acetylglucosaminyl deacetylase
LARRCRLLLLGPVVTALTGLGLLSAGAASTPPSVAQILHELQSFREMGTVLYIAAHPDDENTRLIAYFARGRNYRTGYLSLTRGDGGQDLLGPEFGDDLGVIRTQELLAARRIDGGRQFFSRARDFGFSKDYADTLRKWDRQQVLSDMVRVIREFRPDILVTRFSTVPSTTHGHHTASAVLAIEAFKLAGDPQAFPEQLTTLSPWQPVRIVWNNGFGPSNLGSDVPRLRLDAGGFDPLLGESYGEIAAQSRSMHKSQGMGGVGTRGSAPESFQLLDGAPAAKDIMDGVDTTWARVPHGADVGPMTDAIIAHFSPEDPSASVPALLALKNRLASLPADPVVDEKRGQLDRILQACLGLHVETTIAQAEVVPGETLALRQTVVAQSRYPVRWIGVRYPSDSSASGTPVDLVFDHPVAHEAAAQLPADTLLSEPYWLREEGTEGMFRVDDPSLIGRPESPPIFPIDYVFAVGGQTLVVPDEPVQIVGDPLRGEIHRQLEAVPPVVLGFGDDLELFAPGSTRAAVVEVEAERPVSAGSLRLEAPAGWVVSPAAQSFHFAAAGEKVRLSFSITAPPRIETAALVAAADIGGRTYRNGRKEIRYDHIPVQLLQPVARLKAISLDLAIRSHQVGYLPGAGDAVAESIARMGCTVTPLTGADLTADRLKAFDAVVIGVRAFNTRTDLAPGLPALFAYVAAGGNVIEQYNTPNEIKTQPFAPYDLKLARDLPRHRVTDEKAPVTLLVPGHPAFTTPNRIGPDDFNGWVQERGLNFPSEWDTVHFTALLACSDVGEPPLTSGLLVAHYGQGYFVYTGLSWFRQLPAGVPGAYRLFANLLSLGK